MTAAAFVRIPFTALIYRDLYAQGKCRNEMCNIAQKCHFAAGLHNDDGRFHNAGGPFAERLRAR